MTIVTFVITLTVLSYCCLVAEQLWKVIVELRRRRKVRAEANKPPSVLKENKMKKVLSAFGPPKLTPTAKADPVPASALNGDAT